MKEDTDRVLFTEPNQDLCQLILEDIDTWMANTFEHSDDPTAYQKDHNVNIFSTTTDQHKSQQQVKFGAYAKIVVKKICAFNQNEATHDFEYAPSRPKKLRITVSYAAEVAYPVYRPEFSET
jgi:hypothetical protein